MARCASTAKARSSEPPLVLFRPTMGSKRRSVLLYWVFKYVAFAPLCRLLFRPSVSGAENIPASGAAILVSNHISAGDTFLLPSMIRRRVTFPAKIELFHGRGLKGRLLSWFLTVVGQRPMDRSGGRASASSMESVLDILRKGHLLGIYPEGTRSPDGRLYKGKTGVARLVLAGWCTGHSGRHDRHRARPVPLLQDTHDAATQDQDRQADGFQRLCTGRQ